MPLARLEVLEASVLERRDPALDAVRVADDSTLAIAAPATHELAAASAALLAVPTRTSGRGAALPGGLLIFELDAAVEGRDDLFFLTIFTLFLTIFELDAAVEGRDDLFLNHFYFYFLTIFELDAAVEGRDDLFLNHFTFIFNHF